jgi:hypothetical protein
MVTGVLSIRIIFVLFCFCIRDFGIHSSFCTPEHEEEGRNKFFVSILCKKKIYFEFCTSIIIIFNSTLFITLLFTTVHYILKDQKKKDFVIIIAFL